MDQQLKTKWTTALRSGVYEQAKATLVEQRDGMSVKYCCLAVLLCVSGKYRNFNNAEHGEYYAVIDDLVDRNTREILAAMNDLRGKSFDEIAVWVDRNIKAA